MPTYQYQCTECGNSLEVRQSFTDDALTVCPNCDGTLRKVFNAVGVVFKGSGFYRNDSRSTGTSTVPAKSDAAASSSKSSESSSGKSSSSSDSSSGSSSSGSSGSSGSGSSDSGSSGSKSSAA
ncbi:MAG TPA: FmdB family zinc ribbon protein [Kribbella sp.]|uniref:FmdB family zinc ribbon protein n=1 Tax=Kribbella sp. TaxID=1871183 RepID=UPI002D791A39|nr:FmdB family zinc ribbon protein [Kribbella sp.]HET6294673.1 FmdB family zinc ribbon protein [Kribbella sp.]